MAFEAKRLGINFWGCDLNPTAVLIAKTKSNIYAKESVEQYQEIILQQYDEKLSNYSAPEKINERILYWFNPQEVHELSLLKSCILSCIPTRSKYRYFFLCAFSNILKPTSKWLTKSIKPQIDPKKNPANVRKAFKNQCNIMKKAITDMEHNSFSKIEVKNALKIKRQNVADLIITSPPYVTSYEYADLHQLSTLWLNYAEDYRELRKNSIGSNYNLLDAKKLSKLNDSGKKIVDDLSKVDGSKARAVAKYYLDIQSAIKVCKSALTNNGMLLVVIGNTEYKGVHINNVKHLTESMFISGFNDVCVTKRKISGKILTPYRDESGRFTSNNDKRKVYAEEFIVVGS